MITGEFLSINQQTTYTLEIISSKITKDIIIGSDDIMFSGEEPITINTNCDDMFEHIIKTTCNINLVVRKDFSHELFADNERDILVNVYKNHLLIFNGFLEPNVYSQPYANYYDTLSITANDILSNLRYNTWLQDEIQDDEENYLEYKGIAKNERFSTIISNIFSRYNLQDNIWVTTTKSIHSDNILCDTGIATLLFFGDEKKDMWTDEKIIEEILKYFNYHAIMLNGRIFIFDWDDIKEGKEVIEFYNLADDIVIEVDLNVIQNPKPSSDDTNFDIDDVYTQIELTDNVTSIENVVENPLDEDSLFSPYKNKERYCREIYSWGEGNSALSAFKSMVLNLGRGYVNYEASGIKDNFIQVLNNNKWKFYDKDGNDVYDMNVKYDNKGEYINQWKLPEYVGNNLCAGLFSAGQIDVNPQKNDNSVISDIPMKNKLIIGIHGNSSNDQSDRYPTSSDFSSFTISNPMCEYNNENSAMYSPVSKEDTNYFVIGGKLRLNNLQPTTSEKMNVKNPSGKMEQYDGENSAILRFGMLNPSFCNWSYKTVNKGSSENNDGRYYERIWEVNPYVIPASDQFGYLTPYIDTSNYIHERTTGNTSYISTSGTSQFVHNTDFKSLIPSNDLKDDNIKDFEYTYSNAGDKTDTISKLPILECFLKVGNNVCVEEYNTTTLSDGSIYYEPTGVFNWEVYNPEKDGLPFPLGQTFTIGINPKIGDFIINQDFDIQNTVNYFQNIEYQGTAIPINYEDKLSGGVSFKIIKPFDVIWNKIDRRHPTLFRNTSWTINSLPILSNIETIEIQDFEVKIFAEQNKNNLNDNDILYVSSSNDRFIEKKDDIEFKLISGLTSDECVKFNTSNNVNLNTVILFSGEEEVPLVKFKYLEQEMKAEEHYLNQYYNMYSKPIKLVETSTFINDDFNFFNTYYFNFFKDSLFRTMNVTYNLKEDTKTLQLRDYED